MGRFYALATGLVVFIAVSYGSTANGLTTAYVNFEHPDGWRCELSQGVWICQSTLEPDRKESVVLSIATMKTEWDSIENYATYLKRPRTIQDEEGNTLTSKVTYARTRKINGVQWVDSLQYNSELPGFWARYLATVQGKLAILITYIVSDEFYKKLAPQFERMVASLRPNKEFDLNIPSEQWDGPLPGTDVLGKGKADILKSRLNIKRPKKNTPTADVTPPGAEDGDNTMLLVGVGVLALLGLVVMRKRRAKKAAASKRKEPVPQKRKKS